MRRNSWVSYAIVGALAVLTAAMLIVLVVTRPTPSTAGFVEPRYSVSSQPEPAATATVEATGGKLRVLVLGDSLALGSTTTRPGIGWADLVKKSLSKKAAVQETVIARSTQNRGVTAEDALQHLPGGTFDLVIVEVGTNDAVHNTVEAFKKSYTALLGKIRAGSPHAAVLCLDAWGDKQKTLPFDVAEYNAVGDAHDVYVPITPLFNDESNRWASGQLPDGTKTDNFHPNDTGHAAIAKLVENAVTVR